MLKLKLDPVDIRILRKLRSGGRSEFDPFPTAINPLRKVASELSIDKESVRKRIARLSRQGIFVGWSSMINPNALSLKAARVWLRFQNEEEKKKVEGRLSKIRNVRTITAYFGNELSLVYVDNDVMALRDRFEELHGIYADFKIFGEALISFPECKKKLSFNDRKLYETIRNKFQRSQSDISREASLSLRTVKRRLGEFVDSKAILLLSSLDPKQIDGVALELFVSCQGMKTLDKLISKVSSKFDDSLLSIEQYENSSSSFCFITKNISEASECYEFMKFQDEVVRASPRLIERVNRVRDRLRL